MGGHPPHDSSVRSVSTHCRRDHTAMSAFHPRTDQPERTHLESTSRPACRLSERAELVALEPRVDAASALLGIVPVRVPLRLCARPLARSWCRCKPRRADEGLVVARASHAVDVAGAPGPFGHPRLWRCSAGPRRPAAARIAEAVLVPVFAGGTGPAADLVCTARVPGCTSDEGKAAI